MSETLKSSRDKEPPGQDRLIPRYRPRQVEKSPPCQVACPNCGDIRGWIGTVAQREKTGLSRDQAYSQAWHMITDRNPFPSVLGRICPHPCETGCNRADYDEPLAINAMERFLGDWAIEQKLPLARLEPEAGDEWIGVVGAGPSGLSFAYQMARRGYRVTVYESKPVAGGMLRYGVPDYRLPPAVLDAEIARIMDLGVELRLSTVVGRDISLEELRRRHASLYLGLGAQSAHGLGIDGEEGPSVLTGIELLAQFNENKVLDLGDEVVVIGGGNTAVDAARTALRTGAAVKLVYRRSRAEMPANPHELEDALDEGVELVLQTAPVAIERSSTGSLIGITVCRMQLGAVDESGRRRPEPEPGSESFIEASTVIAAVSQSPVLKGFEALDHDGDWLAGVVADDVLAGGDALGLGIAGNAIVQGRRAAEAVHARLRGLPHAASEPEEPPIAKELISFEHKPSSPAARAERLSGAERLARGRDEVTGTITETQFVDEVERCFSCGACFGCEQCMMFCTTGSFSRLEEARPGMYFTLSRDACIECGKCIEVCPCGFLEAS